MRHTSRRWLFFLLIAAGLVGFVVWESPQAGGPVSPETGAESVEGPRESTVPVLRASPTPSREREPTAPSHPPVPAPIPPFRFRVTAADGQAIGDARISRGAPQDHRELGRTDVEGRLEVVVSPSGIQALSVVVEKLGFRRHVGLVERGQLNEVRLERGVPVEGLVLEAGTNAPVVAATVRAFTARTREEVCSAVTTDGRGRFVLDGVPGQQDLFLVARAEGLHAVAVRRTYPSEEATVLYVGGGGTLEGRVLAANGQPAPGVVVWLMRPERAIPPRAFQRQYILDEALIRFFYPRVVTDENGCYAFRGVAPDQPRIPVAWLSERAEVAARVVQFTESGQTLTRDIALPELGSIAYRVLDDEGHVCEEVQVDFDSPRVWFEERQAIDLSKTGRDGWQTVESLVPGTWHLRAWIPASEAVERTVEVAAGRTTRITLAAARGGVIEGIVVDVSGTPVHRASISWFDGWSARRARADQDGRFSLRSVPDAAGRLEINDGPRMGGPSLSPETLEGVRPGGAPLRIVLHPSGRISGRMPGLAAGRLFKLEIYSQEVSGSGSHKVGEGGRFSFAAPRPGLPFLCKLEHPDRAPRFIECEAMKRGQDLDLGSVRFGEGVELVGVVVTGKGAPVSGATVRLTERWLNRSLNTGEDGAFRFSRLPERPVWVRVDANGYPAHFFIVETHGSLTRRRLQLSSGGRLMGTVFDADDEPLEKGSFMVTWDVVHALDRDLDHQRLSYGLDKRGRVDLWLQPGAYRLRATGAESRLQAHSRIEIRAGETTEFHMQLPRR